MKNELAIQHLIDHFIKEDRIDLEYYNVHKVFGNYESESYHFDDIFRQRWIYKLLGISSISFRQIKSEFGTYFEFPEELFLFRKLEDIDFDENDFEYINENVLKFKFIKKMSFKNNKLNQFPKILTKSESLEQVDLLGNPFISYHCNYSFSESNSFKNIKQCLIEYYQNNPQDYFEFYSFNWGLCLNRSDINIYICNSHNYAITLLVEKLNQNTKINVSSLFKEFTELFKDICKENHFNPYIYLGNANVKLKKPQNSYYYIALQGLKDMRFNEKETYSTYNSDFTFYITDLIKSIGGQELLREIEAEIAKRREQNTVLFQYINNLNIYNYKIFEHTEISEISSSVNVVIGFNGTGKTTLLQAIALGFLNSKSNISFLNSEFNHFNLEYFNRNIENNNNILVAEKYCNIVFNKNYAKRFYRDNSPKIVNDINRNCIFLAYGVNLFNKENFDHKTFAEKIFEGIELPVSVFSIFVDYSDEFYNPLRILDELLYIERTTEVKGEQKKEMKTIRETLLKTINNFLELDEIEKCEIKQTGSKYSFVNKTGAWNLAELSEGYRANTLLITDMLMRILASRKKIFGEQPIDIKQIFNNVQGYILIDEFDRHLHPAWQRRFLSKQKDILPKIQFFVTTHNVFALQSAEGFTVQILNGNNIVSKEITKGLSIEGIYNLYFEGKDAFYSIETQGFLIQFKELLHKFENNTLTKKEEKEFKEITKKLLNYSDRIKGIVTREIRQTGKEIEL